MKTILLELRPDDAEPILRKAAYEAALYGGRVDHVPRMCWNQPLGGFQRSYDEAKAAANVRFLAAKRLVNAFGIEHEPTTEAETMTEVSAEFMRTVGRKIKASYRNAVHVEAAKAAAGRVVRAWRQIVGAAKLAA